MKLPIESQATVKLNLILRHAMSIVDSFEGTFPLYFSIYRQHFIVKICN